MLELNELENEDLKLNIDFVNPICRCCLSTDRNMSSVGVCSDLIEELVGIAVSDSDGLPQWLCWECAALLRKSVRFKQKVTRVHSILYEYSTRCAPFPIDAQDTELIKFASPQLTATEVLNVDTEKSKDSYNVYSHQRSDRTELDVLANLSDMKVLPVNVKKECVKDELGDYGSDYEDNLALNEFKSKLLSEDEVSGLLLDSTEAPSKKKVKKKKVKKRNAKSKKKDSPTDSTPKEPKTLIRTPIVIDPAKIRIINLDPEEQVKQREQEYKSGFKLPFTCKLCYKGFNFESKLENHLKKHSPSRGTFKCELCQMYLPTSYSLNVHNLIHTTRYECVQCGRRMIDRASIVEHYRTQHEGVTNFFPCNICGKVSTNSKTHRGHMRNCHSGERPKCEQCGKTFVNKDGLAAHILIHQGVKHYECDTCGSRFRTRTQIKVHQMKHSDARDHYCVECDVRFKSQYTFRQHLKRSLKHKDWHTFEFGCASCGRRFESAAVLARHERVQHGGERPHRCARCPRALASPAALRKHERAVHRGERPPATHVCDACGRAFRGKSVLINHVRTHTGEKPFACPDCGRRFTQRTALNTHIKLVHLKLRRSAKIKPEVTVEETKILDKQESALESWSRPQATEVYFQV